MNLTAYFQKGFTYPAYLQKIEQQMLELKEKGDPNNFAEYYSLNLKRIERLDHSFELSDAQKAALKYVRSDFKLLTISEGWCGDAAQSVPIVHKIMQELEVEHRIVLRDENPELMDAYLTDGAKSIPIFIAIGNDGKEVFHYGPRPEEGMKMLERHKANPEAYTSDEFHKDLQIWYNKDKGKSIFNDFLALMNN